MPATYINKGIEFSSVYVPNKYTGGRYTTGKYKVNALNKITALPDIKFVNSLDIDFNGAKIDNNQTIISDVADLLIRLENTYTKDISDSKYQPVGEYLTQHQSLDAYLSKDEASNTYQPRGEYLTEHQSLEGLASEEYVNNRISEIIGEAPEALDTLKEIADKLGNNDNAVSGIIETLASKANAEDVYTKNDVYTKEESDAKFVNYIPEVDLSNYYTKDEVNNAFQPQGDYLTEHQSLEAYLSKDEASELYQVKGDYLTEHQSLEGLASEEYVDNKFTALQDELINNEETIAIAFESINNRFDNYSTTVESQEYVDNKIADLINNAPETLDTLKEIADKLSGNDDIISSLTSVISEKANTEDLNNLINICTQLTEKVNELEARINELHPGGDEPIENSKAFNLGLVIPTDENIGDLIDGTMDKPTAVQQLDLNDLQTASMMHLVYPLSWEVVENDMLVSPIIRDENGFEQGVVINSETPTIEYNGVQYRIIDTQLGKGNYTIKF